MFDLLTWCVLVVIKQELPVGLDQLQHAPLQTVVVFFQASIVAQWRWWNWNP